MPKKRPPLSWKKNESLTANQQNYEKVGEMIGRSLFESGIDCTLLEIVQHVKVGIVRSLSDRTCSSVSVISRLLGVSASHVQALRDLRPSTEHFVSVSELESFLSENAKTAEPLPQKYHFGTYQHKIDPSKKL